MNLIGDIKFIDSIHDFGTSPELDGATDAVVQKVNGKTFDIGEKLDPLHVVYGRYMLSQPAVIAVKGSGFGWWPVGRL